MKYIDIEEARCSLLKAIKNEQYYCKSDNWGGYKLILKVDDFLVFILLNRRCDMPLFGKSLKKHYCINICVWLSFKDAYNSMKFDSYIYRELKRKHYHQIHTHLIGKAAMKCGQTCWTRCKPLSTIYSICLSEISKTSIQTSIGILLRGMKKYNVHPIDIWTDKCTTMSCALK